MLDVDDLGATEIARGQDLAQVCARVFDEGREIIPRRLGHRVPLAIGDVDLLPQLVDLVPVLLRLHDIAHRFQDLSCPPDLHPREPALLPNPLDTRARGSRLQVRIRLDGLHTP